MEEKIQFSEIYINKIRCRGFYPKEEKEEKIGEIMLKVFELSEEIRKRNLGSAEISNNIMIEFQDINLILAILLKFGIIKL